MTFEQTRDILTLLQTEYPQSFTKMDSRMMTAKLKLWAKEFENDDFRAVYAAVRAVMSAGNREFAPNIGVIREKMRSYGAPGEMSEAQAWALVSRACANGIYGYQREFDKLPPTVQKVVGRPEQLREWALMDADAVQSVVASNFMRSYKVTAQRERELEKIPENVRELLAGASGKMLMEAGDGD